MYTGNAKLHRVFVLLVLCIIGCHSVWAQNMRVASFRLLEDDLTANRYGTSKTDQNGETTALIKMVTTEQGFVFDGGSLGIVSAEQKEGEWWIYVPRSARRLTIRHPQFGVLQSYTYPVPIEGGRTYQMLLDLGIGRFVTINSSRAGADIEIDGQYVNKAPIYNRYLLYGQHTIKATLGKWEGEVKYLVSAFTDTIPTQASQPVVTVEMQDHSDEYGQGVLRVDNNADIYLNNRHVGTGRWRYDLRKGVYEIETRKADCEPERTTIEVKAGTYGNDHQLKAPTPHTGWLQLYTRPRVVQATDNGQPIDLSEVQTLPVGTHQLTISRRGYVTRQAEYRIRMGETTRDTVQLERVKYVKPLAFYFGAGATVRALSGVTGIVGAVIKGHDLQAFYTFGLSASDPVSFYSSNSSYDYKSTISYKLQSFGLKYGYQFNLMEQIAITPQVGVCIDRTTGSIEDGTTLYADGASATNLCIGAKLLYAPIQHFYLFAAPEFGVTLQKDENFQRLSDASNIVGGGFAATIGMIVNF